MDIFKILTPVIYWLLIISWGYIFIFYLRKYRSVIIQDKLIKTLLVILSIDSFRTLIESIYFGAWYTSLSGIIPISVFDFLAQPQIVFFPKIFNLFAAFLIILILIRKWIPQEDAKLRELKDTVSKQSAKILKTETNLTETNNRLEMALNNSGTGIWELNLLEEKIYCSGTIFSILNNDLNNKYVSFEVFSSLINPEDYETSINIIQDCKINKIENFQIDFRLLFKKKEWKWIQMNGINLKHDQQSNSVKIVGTIMDINDRKKSEKIILDSLFEKETLLKELHHRTKNNMHVIYSMMILSSKKYANKDVDKLVSETGSRIQAMSLVHQKLYQSKDLSYINVHDYIEELANLLIQTYDNSSEEVVLNFDIENISILIDTAIPLGLVLNELMSNTLKHAFPNGQKGGVKIKLSKKEREGFDFTYSDNGIGVPDNFDFKVQNTLGFKLITGIARDQMGGVVDFRNTKGLTCHIVFSDVLYKARI